MVEPGELEILKAEAPRHGCVEPISVADFVHKKFLRIAFKAGGLVVGFNLPFDLSRLAISHNAARVARSPRSPGEIEAGAPLKKADRSMVGGFLPGYPRTTTNRGSVSSISTAAPRFSSSQSRRSRSGPSQRKRGQRIQFQRGNFLDVKTLAAALTSTSHSLRTSGGISRRPPQG